VIEWLVPIVAIVDFPDQNGAPARRLFRAPQRVITTRLHEEVLPSLATLEADCAAGATAVGFLSYEAAPAFDAAFRTHPPGNVPLLWFAVFEQEHIAAAGSTMAAAGGPWEIDTSRAQHAQVIARIREEIAAGTTYQVNFTARLTRRFAGDPLAWYELLRRAAGGGYHAYLQTDEWCVLSVSPELFFEMAGRRIRTRPMKGTRARGRYLEEDERLAEELANSAKERAENLMIVDLMRNDLGRVAETGSVQVERLYDVERYPTVLQLTSTIAARISDDGSLPQIMSALFPPGSVTGAPKISTMRLIAELEHAPRGVYCGAIGIIERGRAVFNVPIRTIWLDRVRQRAEYGAGGGITADADAAAEYDELLTKARVVSQAWPDFELLETMRAQDGVPARLEAHLARLAESAGYFGFRYCEGAIRDALSAVSPAGPQRVRLLLAADGRARVEQRALDALPAQPVVAVAAKAMDSSSPFVFHKTTNRELYEAQAAAAPGVFDVLLYNERDEVTEFTRGNVVLQLGGERVTPPRECGLLAGVFRGELLQRGEITARVIHKKEIAHAERIWFVNSVREWVEVKLV
jgi:para-aminobenzoate synthetase/4-amino-4-deoxychorismate lyase